MKHIVHIDMGSGGKRQVPDLLQLYLAILGLLIMALVLCHSQSALCSHFGGRIRAILNRGVANFGCFTFVPALHLCDYVSPK
jgi:hypothetical protein